MDTMTELLIDLLASTDALHEPLRDWKSPTHNAAVLSRRQVFAIEGMPYSMGGDPASRRRAMRVADMLERDGRVEFTRNTVGRSAWKLTIDEQWRLRNLCLLTGELEMLKAMAGILENFGSVPGSGMVPEITLAGERSKSRMLFVEESLLPGLSLGLISSSSNADQVFYEITPSGFDFLDSWRPKKESKQPFVRKQSVAAAERYLSAIKTARRELRSLTGSTNHVAIPLSVGVVCPRQFTP